MGLSIASRARMGASILSRDSDNRAYPMPDTINEAGEWRGPGGPPGLQNQWWRTRYGTVGSTPMHSRHASPPSWQANMHELVIRRTGDGKAA